MRMLTRQEIEAVSGSASSPTATTPFSSGLVFIAAVFYKLITGKVPSWFQPDY